MAASLSRPDPTSPASVAEAGFSTSRKGFNADEVRAFLTSVAAEMGRLRERERELEAELRAARASVGGGRAELDDETVTALLGEETLRVLQTARESANLIKVRAEDNAARVMREAHDEANRVRQEADLEAARKRHDAQSDAEAEVALAKQQGREMVNEARAYRERVLSDLERRTKLARQQIEELVNGRDRLLQVFERARLVAVDVTSDLQALGTPDEYVSLAPTTGPVPLMVPASRATGWRAAGGHVTSEPQDENTRSGSIDDAIEADPHDGDVLDHAGLDATTEPSLSDASTLAVDAGASTPDARADADADADSDSDSDVDADDRGGSVEEVSVGDATDTSDVATEPSAPGTTPTVGTATNVVSLFRDRPAHEPTVTAVDDDHPARGEPGSGEPARAAQPEPERPTVDDLFAKLRAAVPEPALDGDDHAGDDHAGDDPAGADDAAATPFTRRDEALVPLILAAARKIKRVLADEQNGVLDTLRRKEPVTAVAAILPDLDTHAGIYLDAIGEELSSAASAGASELGASTSPTLRATLTRAGALESAATLVRTELVGALRARIERSVSDGSGDNEAVTKRVRSVYREFKTQHIDTQLDDVFRAAFSGGLAVTVEPGAGLVWTVDPSVPACADCEDNSLAGPIASGQPFPTGHSAAPAHPGCRCLTLPANHTGR